MYVHRVQDGTSNICKVANFGTKLRKNFGNETKLCFPYFFLLIGNDHIYIYIYSIYFNIHSLYSNFCKMRQSGIFTFSKYIKNHLMVQSTLFDKSAMNGNRIFLALIL